MKKTKITQKRIPRGRSGGRKPIYSASSKPTQANLYIPAKELEAFCALVPATADRNRLVAGWMRAYTIAGGESDRLLAQSLALLQAIAYLEGLPESPEELIEKLFSLVVMSDREPSDDSKFWIA
jgi:hypothetical protein